MRPILILPVASALAAALTGCSLVPERPRAFDAEGAAIVAAPVDGGGAQEDIADALLLLPVDAGGVTRMRERHFVNGTRQQLTLQGGGPGENMIEVSLRTANPDPAPRGALQIGPPDERSVRTEIVSRFPDVRMHIVTRPLRNALGDFGLAIGRHANGARCAFAWQWIPEIRDAAPGQSNLQRVGAIFSQRGAPASVRIRLCRQDLTADQLAAIIEGLQLGSPRALDRLLKLDRRNLVGESVVVAGRGTPTTGLIPVPASLESALTGPVTTPRPAAAAKAASAPRPAAAAARAEPRRPTPAAAPPAAEPADAGWRSPEGPRYLAPVDAGGAPATVGSIYAAPPAGSARGARPGSAGLPPQAYLGPSASQRAPAPQGYR